MRNLLDARVLVFLLCALVLVGAPASAKDKAPNFAQAMLDRIELGKPIQGELMILFPLVLKDDEAALPVASQFGNDGLTFEEPEFPDERYGVTARNAGDKPVLVLGGTVLVGGERDRMLRHDCIVPPGGGLEMRAYPAASDSDIRKEIVPFQMAGSLAPIYLRKQGNFGGNARTIPMFIARNLEFRDEGDKRKSLAAIGGSQILQDWTQQSRDALSKQLKDVENRGRIVGAISSMRGRIQGFALYGSRELFQAAGPAYLLGGTYSAAAVAIQAQRKKISLPGADDPEKNLAKVTKEAEKLLANLRKARYKADKAHPKSAVGERLQVQLQDRTRGRAVGVDGKLVHLTAYPFDPFESQLYGSALKLPKEVTGEEDGGTGEDGGPVMSDPNRMGLAELSRWAGRGHRTTHAEQQLLRGIGRGGRGGGGIRGGGGRAGGGGGGRRR